VETARFSETLAAANQSTLRLDPKERHQITMALKN
jgi:hypothetical protein